METALSEPRSETAPTSPPTIDPSHSDSMPISEVVPINDFPSCTQHLTTQRHDTTKWEIRCSRIKGLRKAYIKARTDVEKREADLVSKETKARDGLRQMAYPATDHMKHASGDVVDTLINQLFQTAISQGETDFGRKEEDKRASREAFDRPNGSTVQDHMQNIVDDLNAEITSMQEHKAKLLGVTSELGTTTKELANAKSLERTADAKFREQMKAMKEWLEHAETLYWDAVVKSEDEEIEDERGTG
jgi:hypothetical protein